MPLYLCKITHEKCRHYHKKDLPKFVKVVVYIPSHIFSHIISLPSSITALHMDEIKDVVVKYPNEFSENLLLQLVLGDVKAVEPLHTMIIEQTITAIIQSRSFVYRYHSMVAKDTQLKTAKLVASPLKFAVKRLDNEEVTINITDLL